MNLEFLFFFWFFTMIGSTGFHIASRWNILPSTVYFSFILCVKVLKRSQGQWACRHGWLRTAMSCPASRCFIMTFENDLTAACLRGQGSGRLGRATISSLSFRMFMLVFPVCHVLNYEYAENNNNDNNNNNKKTATRLQQQRPLVSILCRFLFLRVGTCRFGM